MQRITVATRNPHKLVEIRATLALAHPDVDVELIPLPEDAADVIEDGQTFAANAVKKAEAAGAHTGQWALADDSGLEVDALDGAPGVFSARFAGVDGTDSPGANEANNRLLLEKLAGVPDEKRTARFRCVIALARPGQETLTFAGAVEGVIGHEAVGDAGFGYDPLFYYPPFGCTFAEVPMEKKNQVSHRGQALARLGLALGRLLCNLPQS